MTPKTKGERSEAAVLAHVLRRDIVVAIPFGNNQRYDMVIEENGRLLRAQVKTGRLRRGVIAFNASSTSGKARRSYQGQIDLFLVYVPDTDKVYRVPIERATRTAMHLRVSKMARTPEGVPVNWAKDFEF